MPDAYELTVTEDGSPTLTERREERQEAMHSRAGAFTESLEIYDRATTLVMRESWPGHYLSVGLGIGYNEIILAAHALRDGKEQIRTLTSLETSEFLVEQIKNWVTGQQMDRRWAAVYDQIAKMAEAEFGHAHGSVRQYLCDLDAQGQWVFGGGLSCESIFPIRASAIFYDAYSSRFCPELWTETLLAHLLENGAAEQCVFTTYALTGGLKRALTAAGFERLEVTGFAGKRHSTFAVRGGYSNSMDR